MKEEKKELLENTNLPSYEILRNYDVSKWVEKRDGADYLNWAKVVDILHDLGAKKVYFEPIVNEDTGSSLFMTEKVFTDSKQNTNQVYETAVRIVIDNLEFIQRGPVTNGANPVKDNSMSQQRLWNCQTRLFVKGVAIRTGLGFNLWLNEEQENEKKDSQEEDLSKHDILKCALRLKEKLTKIMVENKLSLEDVANKIEMNPEELKAYLNYYTILNRLEKKIDNFDKK